MTADAEIAEDAENVFDTLLTGTFVESTKKLLVAPLCLQNKLLEMADEEIEHAKNGEPAYIAAKVNSLTDKKIINKLVEASCFGVKIELVVRGICCIIPGVPGITENITVRSIVGRFLEHSRIYIFGTDERRKMYISSADYMTRNTVKRVEVAAPVLDERLKKRINCMFDIMLKDNVKARIMKNDAVYAKQPIPENAAEINSQDYFYDEAYKNLAEAAKADGYTILILSSYRDYEYQDKLWKQRKQVYGTRKADDYAARAGSSEHETGYAIDVSDFYDKNDSFKDTESYQWMLNNAHKYGFILRYPEDKEEITGYKFESWHYRYLGVDLATKVYNEGITFDEYYEFYLNN